MVLNQVEIGRMIAKEAAEILDLSLRHVRRLPAEYRKENMFTLPSFDLSDRDRESLKSDQKKGRFLF